MLDRAPLAVLGHRRLAIIDVKHGHQPMSTADEEIWITYNGEVYNFRELRSELEGRGHRFTTNSDTEVILEAYRAWGEACVERLEGMFAFAILDLPRRSLLLARDHLGKKPVYFRWRRGRLDFASELSALSLRRIGRRSRSAGVVLLPSTRLHPFSLDDLPRRREAPAGRVLRRRRERLAEEEILDAGCRFRASSRRHHPETVDDALRQAVDLRLVSEVPLGAFLSGGIDSGLVVSLMAQTLGDGVKTTSVGFVGDPTGGELEAARAVARHHRTDHAELVVEPDAASILGDVMRHFGEPFADSSAIPTWYISRETRRRVTVALSGDGGDETFGGYDFRYFPHLAMHACGARFPASLRAPVFSTLAAHLAGAALAAALSAHAVTLPESGRRGGRGLSISISASPSPTTAALLAPDLARHESEVAEYVSGVYRTAAPTIRSRRSCSRMSASTSRRRLVKVDRMSMAHSLEVRSPLLAKSMVELAFSIPSALKIEGGSSKAILRRLAARYLPATNLTLPKRGFHVPLDEWLRTSLHRQFEAAVLGNGADLAWLDRRAIGRLWDEHRSGRFRHGPTLWAVWAFVEWMRGRSVDRCSDPVEPVPQPRQQSA